MYRVAINTAIVFLKSKKKRDFISTQEDLNFNIKNEDNSEKEYKIKIMYSAIHRLSPIEQNPYILLFRVILGKKWRTLGFPKEIQE